MTTRPVRSIIDDQLDDLVMPAGADIAAVLGLPRLGVRREREA